MMHGHARHVHRMTRGNNYLCWPHRRLSSEHHEDRRLVFDGNEGNHARDGFANTSANNAHSSDEHPRVDRHCVGDVNGQRDGNDRCCSDRFYRCSSEGLLYAHACPNGWWCAHDKQSF